MFGKKKPSPEESEPKPAASHPPGVKRAPAPPPVASWTPPDLIPPAPGPGPAPVHVTADYAGAAVFAANHLAVQGGEEKIILDVASELREQADGGKLLPVTARVVMTAQTAGRLVKALEQALTKLKS